MACPRTFHRITAIFLLAISAAHPPSVEFGVAAGASEASAVVDGSPADQKPFRVGAAAIDITPDTFPVIVNGYTFERTVDQVVDRLMARCLVLDDGTCRAAICVVDSCVLPRDLLDRAKQLAESESGIPAARMLISTTHTHSAPSAMPALGSRVDEDYAKFLPGRIAEAIIQASCHLAPARIGWIATEHPDTHCRLWLRHPGQVPSAPFGKTGERILMAPPYADPANIGPAGPVDRGLTLLSVQSPAGEPVALLANYGMHFVGAPPLSADWCGQFARRMEEQLGRASQQPPLVAIMSQGTSGDQHWMDFSGPKRSMDHVAYGDSVAKTAEEAYGRIEYHDWAPLAMAEKTLSLAVREVPPERLAWAETVVAEMGDRPPKTRPEVYAREQILFSRTPKTRELKLQAIRIGELAVTAIPCKVYGLTGLKLKAQSPALTTMNIALANGEEGYIPPPEQHALGGYSTWEARTSCLEVGAEPKIVEAVLDLLEEVTGRPRREIQAADSPFAKAVLASRPIGYWRLQEMSGPTARDALGRRNGVYEPKVAHFLEGPDLPGLQATGHSCRAAHFAGGRVAVSLPELGDVYSVELWFWNGLPHDLRPVTGYFFSKGDPAASDVAGDHLGIGGAAAAGGRLVFFNGHRDRQILEGKTTLEPKTWNHVVLVRKGRRVDVYQNGNTTPEISGDASVADPTKRGMIFLGGRSDGFANLEGKLSEVAVYDRALGAEEVASHYQMAAGMTRSQP